MRRLIPIYCLLAGACDGATGVALVSAPGFTLRLMGIAPLPVEPVYLRFVGVFVGGVGFAYLYPFVLAATARWQRLTVVLEVTALIRLAVAAFVGASIALGALTAGWGSVAVTDLVLAGLQIWMLRRLSGPATARELEP